MRAGGHWPHTARAACGALVKAATDADEDRSLAAKLLADISQVFAEKFVSFLPSGELVSALRSIDESPWQGFDLNPSKLAYRLKQFDIKPGRDSTGKIRGYRLETFTDAFSRYLRQNPSEASETADEQQVSFDTPEPSDTLDRQTEIARQDETAGQVPLLTLLTGSDAPAAENGSAAPEGRTTMPRTREQTITRPAAKQKRASKFQGPTGPGRCPICCWHPETQQGHADWCTAEETAR